MSERPRIGVALSGGGVRGLAHLGVLEVLDEAHVPVDFIAGTSMGGIVAGLYAAGVPLHKTIGFAEHMGLLDIASRGPGLRGLFGHAKIAQLLAELLGSENITFEDMKIPTAVLAADLETGELVILNRGPLIPALLATSAFPVMLSPVYHQRRWLVDGGVLNNFPVDLVRQMGADRVLGVDTPPSVHLNIKATEEKVEERTGRFHLSPRALFSSFTPRTPDWKLPILIAETAAGFTANLVNETRLSLNPPDLLLTVNLPNVGTFSTGKNVETIAAGRSVAREALPELRRMRDKPLPSATQRRWRGFVRRLRRAWQAYRSPDYTLYPPAGGPPVEG